ncbi:MAG: hypothetical protein WEC75_06840 [Dehalococcoidia bacterium]
MIDELLAEQARRPQHRPDLDLVEEAKLTARRPSRGLRHTVASSLVGLAMKLDHTAGEQTPMPVRSAARWEDGHGVCS